MLIVPCTEPKFNVWLFHKVQNKDAWLLCLLQQNQSYGQYWLLMC